MIPMEGGPVRIFEEPDPAKPYAIFCDSAECLDEKSDYQAFAVIDPVAMRIVATGMERWPTHDFAKIACIVGYYYNEALLAFETNDTGMACLAMITGRTGFTDETEYLRLIGQGAFWYNRLYVEWNRATEAMKRSNRLGWKTSRTSKRVMIAGLDKLISYGQIDIPDIRFWQQAKYYYNLPGGKMGAKVGNDDLIMAVAGAAQIAAEARLYKPVRPSDRKVDKFAELRAALESDDDDAISEILKRMTVRTN